MNRKWVLCGIVVVVLVVLLGSVGIAYSEKGSSANETIIPRVWLPVVMNNWPTTCWAKNRSYNTTCAEEDNVNVPIFCVLGQKSRFRVVATHPTYEVGMDNCAPDFSGCSSGAGVATSQTTNTCQKLWDDGTNVIEVCTEPSWWRPYSMSVVVRNQVAGGHRLVLYRKIEGEASWPQFLVLYEDGNMRLKPHPPMGRSDVCFGSSVIIGPATPAQRPYVDIQEVRVNLSAFYLDITYRNGETAHINSTSLSTAHKRLQR